MAPSRDQKSDVLCEMRFFVPNMVQPKEEPAADPEKKKEENKDEELGDNEEEEKVIEKTSAELLSEMIVDKAGIGVFSGEMIALVPKMPLLVPRGKYDIEMYETFLRFHGITHDYKIMYKDILRAYLLPKPN